MTGSSVEWRKIEPRVLRPGNCIRSKQLGGRHFIVDRVEKLEHGVYVWKDRAERQNYPEFFTWDHELELYVYTPDPKPYKVITRDYDKDGNCDKRTFEFKTQKQQLAFIMRTNRCVTFTIG